MDNITNGNSKSKFNAFVELLRPEGFRRVCRALEHAIGTAEASLYAELLGRGAYFAENSQLDDEGYFFNTVIDLQIGTALSDFQQRRAIKQLQELGLISVRLKGSPPKRYFKLAADETALINYLQQGREIMQALEIEKQKQKQRIEEERLKQQGYFKSKETSYFKSEETSELNLKKLQTNKNKANKNKREEEEPASTLLNIYLNNLQEKTGSKVTTTNRQNVNALKKLVNLYGKEEAADLVKLWFATADKGTANKGWPVGFLLNQLTEYKNKLQDYQEEQQREAAAAERNRQQQQEEREQAERLAREKAEFEALPEIEKARHELNRHNEMMKSLRPLREEAAAQGDKEAAEKLKQYDNKEAELKAKISELETEAI